MAASLFKRSFALLAAAALVAAIAFTGLSLLIMDRIYAEANMRVLGETACALAPGLPRDILAPGEEGRIAAAAWAVGAIGGSDLRLTLIRPDGVVVADTRADPSLMENHGKRPEVLAALSGSLGTARRRSATIGRELMYAAYPLVRDGQTLAILRLAIEVPSLRTRLSPELGNLLLLVAAFIAAAAGAAAAFSGRLARPLVRLAGAARSQSLAGRPAEAAKKPVTGRSGRFRGLLGLDARVPDEYRVLAASLDAMAEELARRVEGAESQGRELEAVLDAMAEAVLALDGKLRIRLANPAAARLFGAAGEPDAAQGMRGRELLETTRSVELNALVEDCLRSGAQRQTELALYQNGERWYQALAAAFTPFGSEPGAGTDGRVTAGDAASTVPPPGAGVVLVLNDITELRRLERVRRDFVANVSHELRTPVQLIKGFAETLREEQAPDQQNRFLAIIERNAARMENLIHDLLTLARLEQEGSDWLAFDKADIGSTLKEAIDAIAPKADEKAVRIELSCPPRLYAHANAGLLEQAVLNLVDNAVKYSPRGSRIRVEASVEERAPGSGPLLNLSVRDSGTGIPARDLNRIFERFYRVDKARSRELGGTGLGLAIVRHVALAHGGSVSVESWEGEGSLFTIRIPLNAASDPGR